MCLRKSPLVFQRLMPMSSMRQGIYSILKNDCIAKGIYKMVLEGDTSAITASGQFVNIKLDGRYLRRPISINDWDETTITLLYKVVGGGTEQMSKMLIGDKLDILVGLGNGFSLDAMMQNPLLVGGGIGLAPLFALCKLIVVKRKIQPVVVIGATTKQELFYVDEFKNLGAKVVISTDDGSEGTRGFVTDAIKSNEISCDYFYTCGPMPMMRALNTCLDASINGQFSLEERMGCGFGACVGCSIETRKGVQRVCKDGPIFMREEVIW